MRAPLAPTGTAGAGGINRGNLNATNFRHMNANWPLFANRGVPEPEKWNSGVLLDALDGPFARRLVVWPVRCATTGSRDGLDHWFKPRAGVVPAIKCFKGLRLSM